MSLVKPVHVNRVEVPAQSSWVQRAFHQSPAVQWVGRTLHTVKASEQRTLSSLAGLVEAATQDVRPELAHSARLMREESAAAADRHRQIAQETYGALSGLQDVRKLSDLGNVAITNALELSVPLATAALASRAGLPGVALAGAALNTAFNVDHQRRSTGQTDVFHAATVALPQTALQFAVGPLFRNTNPLSWFTGGATVSAAHHGLQQSSVIGQPHIDNEMSVVTRALEGGLTGMVLGPLSSWSPPPTLRSTAPHQSTSKSVQFTADHPLQVGSSPKTPAPRDASFSSIHAQGSSFLGVSINRRLHMPEFELTGFSRGGAPSTLNELAKNWGQGIKADSSLENLQNMWMDNGFDFPEVSTIRDYVGLAHELLATRNNIVWRKEKMNGSTVVFDSEKNIWLETDCYGLPITMYRPKGGLKGGLNAWNELSVIPHALTDYPVALKNLKNLTDTWIKEGMSLEQASQKALALRRKIEKSHQRNTGADSIVLREQNQIAAGHQYRKAYSYGPSYSLLAVKLDKSPAEILEIATTANEYFAAMPPAFAKAHQEWLTHGHKFPELKNEYGFSWRAFELSRASGPDIQRQKLFNGEIATYHSPSKTIVLANAQGDIRTMYTLKEEMIWHRLLRAQPPLSLTLNSAHDHPKALRILSEVALERMSKTKNERQRQLVAEEIVSMRQIIEKTLLSRLDPGTAEHLKNMNKMISGSATGANIHFFVKKQGIKDPRKIINHAVSNSAFYARIDPATLKAIPPYSIKTPEDEILALNALAAIAHHRVAQITDTEAAHALLSLRRSIEEQLHQVLPAAVAHHLKVMNQNLVGHPLGPDVNFLSTQHFSAEEMIEVAINGTTQFYARPTPEILDGTHND